MPAGSAKDDAARADALEAELAHAPRWKKDTGWYRERVSEVRQLRERADRRATFRPDDSTVLP